MSQNIRDQIQNLDIKVEAPRPPKEYSRFDDFALVTDLRPRFHVLFIGGNAVFPTVKNLVKSVTTVKNRKEVEKLKMSENFDRIFVVRETVLSEELVTAAAQLLAPGGLICFFSEDEGLRAGFIECVERNYPTAQFWPLRSNVGPLILTDAQGNPAYLD